MLHPILARSRYLMLIAVFGSFVASVTLLIYGTLETVISISHTTKASVSRENSKQLILSFIEVVNLFLLAIVFYITALGFYELFIENNIQQRDPRFIERIVSRRGSADRTAGRTSFRFEGVSL